MTDLAMYYAARAAEYEHVYEKPERQEDISVLRRTVAEYFAGSTILEVACGTGYWTNCLATTAKAIVATDVSDDVLDIAKAKPRLAEPHVTLRLADAMELAGLPRHFDAAFAGFWWSHVRRDDLSRFLGTLHQHVTPDARVMFVDNRYVEGSSTPIGRRDSGGNTFQERTLRGGSKHEVLKNFPSSDELHARLAGSGAREIEIVELPYYWYATYRVLGNP